MDWKLDAMVWLRELPKGVGLPAAGGIPCRGRNPLPRSQERVTDRGDLGLFFAAEPSPDLVTDVVLEAKGEAGQKFRAVTRLTAETHVLALWPETTSGVKSIEVSARKPDGGTEVLLFAKDLQMDWPTPYILKEPVALPKGTDLSLIAYGASVRLTLSGYRK